jgi:hypothetical protein
MKSFGRLLMAAALIVPVGVVTAQSAGAVQGGQGKFTCTASTGTFAARPGLLLGQKKDQRITEDATETCTGGFVTGGAAHLNVNEERQNCASLSRGPAQGANGTIRVIWNKGDKAGQSVITINLKVTATSGHTTSGTLTGKVRMGALAVGKNVTGTFAINKGLMSRANGGDCAALKRLTDGSLTDFSFATS